MSVLITIVSSPESSRLVIVPSTIDYGNDGTNRKRNFRNPSRIDTYSNSCPHLIMEHIITCVFEKLRNKFFSHQVLSTRCKARVRLSLECFYLVFETNIRRRLQDEDGMLKGEVVVSKACICTAYLHRKTCEVNSDETFVVE